MSTVAWGVLLLTVSWLILGWCSWEMVAPRHAPGNDTVGGTGDSNAKTPQPMLAGTLERSRMA